MQLTANIGIVDFKIDTTGHKGTYKYRYILVGDFTTSISKIGRSPRQNPNKELQSSTVP